MSMLARAYLHLRIERERGRGSFLPPPPTSLSLSLPLAHARSAVHSFVREHVHARARCSRVYSTRGIINRGPMSGFHSLSLPLARQLGGHLRNAIVFADVLRPKYRAFGTNTADYPPARSFSNDEDGPSQEKDARIRKTDTRQREARHRPP